MNSSFKKLALLLTPFILGVSGCNRIEPIDYSKVESWHVCEYNGSKEVDTFFVYPTVVNDETDLTTLEQNRNALRTTPIFERQASVYAESTNIYIPLYRQTCLPKITLMSPLEMCNMIHDSQGYKDLENCLDYYFEHFNNNKPFILAGHSQGSAQLFNIMTDYMQKHQDYLSRMVACYAIGFGQTKSEIAKYPNLKLASGECDTNCIISYNTFNNNHVGPSVLHDEDSFVINPINWKTDETVATREESKGSYLFGEHIDGVSGAKVDLSRGILVSDADSSYEVPGIAYLFGTNTFHSFDYSFFYSDLVENVAKRIEAFKNN